MRRRHANDVLKNAVGGISDIIQIRVLVNVDFEVVKTVVSEPGNAMMGTAVADGPDRATEAGESALTCPLLGYIALSGARGVLVLIAASKHTFKLAESPSVDTSAMNAIERYAVDEAHVICGTAYDESLGDQLRVTVIGTGLASARKQIGQLPVRVPQPLNPMPHGQQHTHVQPQVRTGAGHLPILNQVAGGERRRNDAGAAAQLRGPEHAQRLAQRTFTGRGEGRCAGQQRHGRDRDSGVSAQAGGLTVGCRPVAVMKARLLRAFSLESAERVRAAGGQLLSLAAGS